MFTVHGLCTCRVPPPVAALHVTCATASELLPGKMMAAHLRFADFNTMTTHELKAWLLVSTPCHLWCTAPCC